MIYRENISLSPQSFAPFMPHGEVVYHCSTWAASGRRMEVGEPQAISRQFVDVGCAYLSAKTAQVGESQVICHNDEKVGSFRRGLSVSHVYKQKVQD